MAMQITSDMALVASASMDPKWYHYIRAQHGDTFLTDATAKECWKLFDPESGTWDDIAILQLPGAWDKFTEASDHIDIVREYHVDQWIDHCRTKWQAEVIKEATHRIDDIKPHEQIGKLTSALEKLYDHTHDDVSEREVADALADIDRLARGEKSQNAFGWPHAWMGPFGDIQKHEFIVIGGRPGTGKSALMGQLAYDYAKLGKRCLYLSLEMTAPEIYHRWAAYECGFSVKRIPHNLERSTVYRAAYERIAGNPNLAVCNRSTIGEILAEINTRKTHGLDVIFVDYLQLIQGAVNRSRVEELSGITRSFKRVAMSGTPVICGSQLNRENQKEDSKPQLHHLRESGSIEQDADRVILLHSVQATGDHYLIQAKLRNGPNCTLDTVFEKETTSFKQLIQI